MNIVPKHLQILGKVNMVACIILAVINLIVGFMVIANQVAPLDSFWEYFMLWQHAESLILFIPISALIVYYGAFHHTYFRKYVMNKTYSQLHDLIMGLNVRLVITLCLLLAGTWQQHLIIMPVLIFPLIYQICIYHYLATTDNPLK